MQRASKRGQVGCGHRGEGPYPRWVVRRQVPRDNATQVVTDKMKALVPQRFSEIQNVLTRRVEAVVDDVGRSGPLGTEAAQVRGDRTYSGLAEAAGLPAPRVGGLGEAMQENGQQAILWSGGESCEESPVYPGVQLCGHRMRHYLQTVRRARAISR